MQYKGYMNIKRGLNSVANPRTQFNYNITFEINWKVINANINKNYLFFAV